MAFPKLEAWRAARTIFRDMNVYLGTVLEAVRMDLERAQFTTYADMQLFRAFNLFWAFNVNH